LEVLQFLNCFSTLAVKTATLLYVFYVFILYRKNMKVYAELRDVNHQ